MTDYIYAYMETAMNLGQPVPTIMFVLHNLGAIDPHPMVVPFNLETYDLETLDGFLSLLIEQYPPTEYGLNMILYARFEDKYRSKGEFDALFGACDTWGSSIHSSYRYIRHKTYEELKHKPISSKYFDKWVQRPKVKDEFLTSAVAQYHTLITMKAVRTYV